MRVLILCDLLNNWALHNRAKAIKKFLPDFDIQIMSALDNMNWMDYEKGFDLIHFNFTYGITHYLPFLESNMFRSVITIVNERSLLDGHGVEKYTLRRILERCPNVTSVSQRMCSQFIGNHVKWIPNGIDADIFSDPKKIIVGYAGVSDKENKNVSAIEKACGDLGLELRVAGYNRLDEKKHAFPHERMNDFYKDLSVYVHASKTEGFNNTVIEALACNVPVLMTRQGCWREFEGWVDFIEPDFYDIQEKLKKFTGRRLIEERFLWKNIVPQYREVYESAFARTSKI